MGEHRKEFFNFVKNIFRLYKREKIIRRLRKRKIVQQRYNVLANVFLC